MRPTDISRAVTTLTKIEQPVFIWGPPGVGKSDVIAQVAKQREVPMVDVRLSLMDPTDIKGFPQPDKENGVMHWLPPNFLPRPETPRYGPPAKKGGAKELLPPVGGILFLDEFNSAPTAVQAASYQLMLNRRVGDYELPPGWAIVAAGNRDTDRSVVNRMPMALANRMIHLQFEINHEDWYDWAAEHDIDPMLIAYLRFKKSMLHVFDPAKGEDKYAFPTPRSWSFASKIMANRDDMSINVLRETLQGTVGAAAAKEYLTYREIADSLPTLTEVLLNPADAKCSDEPSVQYAIVSTLALSADSGNFGRMLEYMQRLPVEHQVIFVRTAAKRDTAIQKSSDFQKWGQKNQKVLL